MAKRQREITGAEIVAEVRRYLGRPYVYGAAGPNAFDCSGLVQYSLARLGINAPRTSEEQFTWAKPVAVPRPGNLVFFVGSEQDPPPGHVGIVVAPGLMINAPHTGLNVEYDHYSTSATGVNKVMGFRAVPNTAQSPSASAMPVPQRGTPGKGAVVTGFLIGAGVLVFMLAMLALLLWTGYKIVT